MINNSRIQRALVLSGGGALGAYEAGSILELCDYIIKKDKINKEIDRPVFDTVAGTSIGAINASILVSEYLEKRKEGIDIVDCWKLAAQKPIEFWKYCSVPTPDIKKITNDYKIGFAKGNLGTTSQESFRRYIAGWYFLNFGLEKFFSKPETMEDKRFGNKSDVWYKYNNDMLRESIKRFANFPIATSFENKEPRLLVVGVDIQEGETVTFDSYAKPDGFRKTQYGYDKNTKKFEHTIEYPQGLTIEHIMASSAVPSFYDYEEIQGRKIWDGILLSNTPLRETMDEHRAYWEYKRNRINLLDSILNKNSESTVPDLEVYVVNLYPKKEKKIPCDQDAVKNRIQNILNCGKTSYDELVSKIHTDLSDVIQKLVKLGIENGLVKNIEPILNTPALGNPYTYLPKEKMTFQDLIKGIFRTKVISIERKDDEHSVWSKFTDITDITINRLIEEGKKDTKDVFRKM